jgi:hypothetical protein
MVDADHHVVAADRCSDGSHQSTESDVPDLVRRVGQEVVAKDHDSCRSDVSQQPTIPRIQVDARAEPDDEMLS